MSSQLEPPLDGLAREHLSLAAEGSCRRRPTRSGSHTLLALLWLQEEAACAACGLNWARLGLTGVACLAGPCAGGDAHVGAAELEAFAREAFLRDPGLARAHAPNKGVSGLYPRAFWVRSGSKCLWEARQTSGSARTRMACCCSRPPTELPPHPFSLALRRLG